MPREARQKSSTDRYHIMVRGINKFPIFNSNADKYIYLNFFKLLLEKNSTKVYAYCIMHNHAHFLFEGNLEDISKLMKQLNQKFAMSYNNRNNRIGHLFQDRYKSECIEDKDYFLSVIRYIHNNPVVAGIEKYASNYRWSSMSEYEWNKEDLISKQSIDYVMIHFQNQNGFMNFHKKQSLIQHLDIDQTVKSIYKDINKAKIIFKNITLPSINEQEFIRNRNKAIREVKLKTKLKNIDISKLLNISEASISKALKFNT